MEFSCNIGFEEDIKEDIKNTIKEKEIISEKSLVPREGFFLGLDISETNTGICMYRNGEKMGANAYLESKDGDFYEVRLRRELKECLKEVVSNITFDVIIVEDAFQGVNPMVTRKLYAINTAIDELILDGVCGCKKFLRVNNKLWKSWLFSIDTEGLYKSMEDKERIENCLRLLGVYEEHDDGYQDRLDSCGMLLGYFLKKDEIEKSTYKKTFKKVSMSDVEFAYEEDIEAIKLDAGYGQRDIVCMYLDEKRMSESLILSKLTELPNVIYITNNKVNLGLLGNKINVAASVGGGYFGFWVKENKIRKYMDLEDFNERLSKL